MHKLYTGKECYNLFKEMFYKYYGYSIPVLKNKIHKMYDQMEYANDYVGIQIKTMSILIYMKENYDMKIRTKNDMEFWFNVFIKQITSKIY